MKESLGEALRERPLTDWHDGLLDCCGSCEKCQFCCLASFCQPLAYGEIASRFYTNRFRKKRTTWDYASAFCIADAFDDDSDALVLNKLAGLRRKMRIVYNIDENGCVGCLAMLCCAPCGMTQMMVEVKKQKLPTKAELTQEDLSDETLGVFDT